jgi:monofunctional biosynthetic peptidoglycan transglycosylase
MRRALRWVWRILIAVVLALAGLTVVYRFVPPVSTLMLARWATGEPVAREWRPLDRISPHLPAAVISSEDARYCSHGGVDWTELRTVVEESDDGLPARGASTLAMQTVKNVLLWPSRSVVRKVVELPLALFANLVWGKRRTIEIYLNVAEWGDGVFGAEAAARRHFNKSAADLTPREAALLAAALPNPILRNAGKPTPRHRAQAARIERRARLAGDTLDCVRQP